ncbi:fidgetin-like protein 1 isoform X1 [Branchiostoma lanceolatum]|uniref:fidgetin-like protein 1 isoform X1 n=1 Tax=Branchiostoma lanceolatum TaxID=7740 RepID=UPI00345444F6
MTMQHDPEQAQHLHRWQKPYFDGKVAEAYPAQKADALRGQCGQIQYAWATDNITELTASMLLKQYAEKYVNVVDNTDGNTGLNNYADGALSLASGHRNESGEWQTSLSMDNMQNMQGVQDLMSASKVDAAKMMNSSTADIPLSEQTASYPVNSSTCMQAGAAWPYPNSSCVGKDVGQDIGMNAYHQPDMYGNTVMTAYQDPNGAPYPPPQNVQMQMNHHPVMNHHGPMSHPGSMNHGGGMSHPHPMGPQPGGMQQGMGPAAMQGIGQHHGTLQQAASPVYANHQNRNFRANSAPSLSRTSSSPNVQGGSPMNGYPAVSSPSANTTVSTPGTAFPPTSCNVPPPGPTTIPAYSSASNAGYSSAPTTGFANAQSSGYSNAPSAHAQSGIYPTPASSLKRKASSMEGGDQNNYGSYPPYGNHGNQYGGTSSCRYNPREGGNMADPNRRDCMEESGNTEDQGSMNFCTAREQLAMNNQKKYGRSKMPTPTASSYGNVKKSLGARPRGPSSKFVPPVLNKEDSSDDGGQLVRRAAPNKQAGMAPNGGEPLDERLKNIEPKLIEMIQSEIMDHGPPVSWDDIAGLEFAKATIKEIVIWPMLRPDIFKGLRGPPKGLLLFGPPGTGKTLIGKCIASQSGATFFSISASSLTSKWVGEGEKLVRALFAVARCHQPAVVFIDEIDSLLSSRAEGEHDASRRIKTEFLVQFDGVGTNSEDRILIIGATNRPQEIDEAARRRLVKRLYIPLPDYPARCQIVHSLMSTQNHSLTEDDVSIICQRAEGYSGADMANLCREAALGPIRSIQGSDIQNITPDQVRPILFRDCEEAFRHIRPSVTQKDLDLYVEWNKQFGSGAT